MEEILGQDKWFKETGNAVIAEKKSPNCHLSQLRTGQSIAAIAGPKIGRQDRITATKRLCDKKSRLAGFFVGVHVNTILFSST